MTIRNLRPACISLSGHANTSGLGSLAWLLLTCLFAAHQAVPQTGNSPVTSLGDPQDGASLQLAMKSATASDVVHITVGRSVVLTSTTPLRRVYVGNPAVLQTYTSGSTEIVLTAKAAGGRSRRSSPLRDLRRP